MMTLQKLSSILMKMVWGKFRYVFIPECLEAGSQSHRSHSRSPNAFLASS